MYLPTAVSTCFIIPWSVLPFTEVVGLKAVVYGAPVKGILPLVIACWPLFPVCILKSLTLKFSVLSSVKVPSIVPVKISISDITACPQPSPWPLAYQKPTSPPFPPPAPGVVIVGIAANVGITIFGATGENTGILTFGTFKDAPKFALGASMLSGVKLTVLGFTPACSFISTGFSWILVLCINP